jgi:phage shock protein A
MGIFSRFSDIVNSNITAMLDSAEDPKKMIRLIIQEMEETLIEVRSSCARIIADKKEVSRRLSRLSAEAREWESKAKLAISKGRDDLARAAIAEKNTIEEEIASAESELESLEEHLATLNDEVGQLQVKLDDAKAKQKALMLRAQTVENRYKVKRQINKRNIDDAFTKFELFQRRMDELEGQVEAMDVGRNDLASEIDQLAKDDAINDELNRLKEQMGSKQQTGS